LIFSIGAISIKVNHAFVSILIIASSLAIHLSIYIQPSYRLWGWAPFMALTPFLRCVRPLLWGGPNLDSYHGPHTFHPRCLRLSAWDGPNLDSYHGPHTFHLRCLCLSSWDGLYLGLFHGPHTFFLRCLRSSSCDGLYLASYHSPHTYSWGVSARRHAAVCTWAHIMAHTPYAWGVSVSHEVVTSSFIGDVSSDSKILYHHVDLGEITATNHIERDSCGALFTIFHLIFYVWSFYAFLLDSSTYTNSLWCLRLSS